MGAFFRQSWKCSDASPWPCTEELMPWARFFSPPHVPLQSEEAHQLQVTYTLRGVIVTVKAKVVA